MSLESDALKTEPEREPVVSSALSHLSQSISELNSSVSNLRTKLNSVSRSEVFEEPSKDDRRSICEVTDIIYTEIDRINDLKMNIDHSISVLEV